MTDLAEILDRQIERLLPRNNKDEVSKTKENDSSALHASRRRGEGALRKERKIF